MRMIASMAMESTLGMTANSTKASGRMASNMEKVNIFCLQGCNEGVYGAKEIVKSG